MPFAILGGIGFVICTILWLVWRFEKKRTQQILEAAGALGFESLTQLPTNLDGVIGSSKLMSTGRNRVSSNIVRRQASGLDVLVFDYRYTVGHGKSAQTPHQTVAVFRSDRIIAPRFFLKPEGWVTKLGEIFGSQDIDFEECPEFSRKYVLAGENEEAIREFFTIERLTLLSAFNKLCLEVQSGSVLVWFDRKRSPGSEFQQFFEQAFSVYSVLASPK